MQHIGKLKILVMVVGVFIVTLMLSTPVMSSRYLRLSSRNMSNVTAALTYSYNTSTNVTKTNNSTTNNTNTLIPLYKNNSIKELMELCTPASQLECPYSNITNTTLKKLHADYLKNVTNKVRWVIDRYKHPMTFGIQIFIFAIALVLGVYLVLIKHLDWRLFGHEIVSDGSFGFYLRIIKSMGYRVAKISNKEFEKIVDERMERAMRAEEDDEMPEVRNRRSTIGGGDLQKKKILTREEMHELEHEHRALRLAEQHRHRNEEALMTLELKKSEETILRNNEAYHRALVNKYPVPNATTQDPSQRIS